ncbi:replication protein A 70 kDa DNA-binding subunit B [Artemisia annua]|uniref:Replication protein A 70 kDa DNA-binding subunit B n=1 Tax=Artemisia annua TaxID=35608 RepID=A0A2U1MY26_ARTAN|nr:replication protein A 70 kDa DNA-binding subunit B [Artemisia annua]
MATYVAGFINDLSAVKDNIKLRVRIVRSWMQDVYGKQGLKNMELVIMDEQGIKMQVTMRMALVNGFKHKVEEGSAVTLSRYSLGEIQPKPFRTIVDLQQDEDGQFDVIGHVVACDDLDNYEKNGRSGKKKPLTLADADGNELRCTLWGSYAQQFQDFVDACPNRGKIMLILQFGMMKIWDGKMGVQNAYNGTRLFLVNGNEIIPKEEFVDVELYRLRLFADKDEPKSENRASHISTQSKHSAREEFLNKLQVKNIVELLAVDQGKASVIVGTIIAIHEEEGWWYLGCHKCNKKVVKESQFVDLEAETKPKFGYQQTPDQWTCTKCAKTATGIKTEFRHQIRVQDESDTISLSLFNDEVQAMVGRSAYQLCDKYGCKNAEDQVFPKEITNLVGKKYAFKVSIDEVNAKKMLPVFTILRLTDDAEILNSVVAIATPVKDPDATTSAVPQITPLDLESQTDENTTPVDKQKSSKRSADVEHESDGSSMKKQIVEIKMEKEATK